MRKIQIARVLWICAAVCTVFACGPSREVETPASSVAARPAASAEEPLAAEPERAPQEPRKKERTPIDPAQVGTIRGVVRFDGPPPERKEMAIGNTAGCEKHLKLPLTEDVIVTDGRLQNVFVHVKQGLDGWVVPAPTADPVVLDQQGCMYRPRVIGLRTGQKLVVRNSDGATHNVHSRAERNDSFNRTQSPGGADVEWIAEKPELMIPFGCDIHPWMKAWVGVRDHPFFAVSATDGGFAIAGLPPGEYTLEAWHEKLGKKTKNVTLSAGGTADIEFVYAGQ